MKKLLFIFILIALSMLLISCANQELSQPFDPMESSIFRMADVKNARVLERLEVKSGASDEYNTIAVLNSGDVVRVLGKIDDWYVVRLENYRVGCIDSTKTEPVVRDNRQPQTPKPAQPEQPDRNADDEPEAPGQEPNVPGEPTDPAPTEPTPEEPEPVPEEPQQPTVPDTPVENVDTRQESQLLNLINQERSKNGLPTLSSDPEVTRVARIKAQDMIDNDYFSHYSPTYGSPFDMLKQFGVDYQYAGENLAQNTSVDRAHTALMNSSGHRKNILNPNFTHVGLGIKQADRGYIYVEIFIGVPR